MSSFSNQNVFTKVKKGKKSRKSVINKKNTQINNNTRKSNNKPLINQSVATIEKAKVLNENQTQVSKNIDEQMQISNRFIENLQSGSSPTLTNTHFMNFNYSDFDEIVLVDHQNLHFNKKITTYKNIITLCADLTKKMSEKKMLFIIVKPKTSPGESPCKQDKNNNNIILLNVECLTPNKNGTVIDCYVNHGFNESDDFVLILLYDFLKKNNINVSIISGDHFSHTNEELKYFYFDESIRKKNPYYPSYYKQFSSLKI
jgi:hypothetical protein